MLPPLLVFCHLRWDFVYQRPQHLISRLAKNRKVYFIEEPFHTDKAPYMERYSQHGHVQVIRPHTNLPHAPSFKKEQAEAIKPLLAQFIAEENLTEYVAWLYTALAVNLVKSISPSAIIYDCMDELSAFKGAPPELLDAERELLQIADAVFTGGPSLYKAKRNRHANVHCFSSSVDAAHFAAAKESSATAEHETQKDLSRPRLGFYGVIDERFDVELLKKMADAHPEWQIVMVGPVFKIDPADLPKNENIHYMGQRTYAELPQFLRGWDVCLLPFALNESTKFISPTKTLEYMAAERMIVSTPITDVVEPYGDIVKIGHTHEEFIKHCEDALSIGGIERAATAAKFREVLSKTSWDATAHAMSRLIDEAVSNRASRAQIDVTGEAKEIKTQVAVIGAGPTGLSAAYHLGKDALLIEQNDTVGGWCRSIEDKGFTFDYAGHIMFSNDPYVHEMYKMLLGDNVHWQNREAWVYSKNVYTRYPFQGALYGLPPETIKECIVGAIEARFGPLSTKADDVAKKLHGGNGSLSGTAQMNGNGHKNGNGHSNGHANGNGVAKACKIKEGDVKDCCGDGIMEAEVQLTHRDRAAQLRQSSEEPKNFEEFIYKVWGWGIGKHFAIPYNKKIWAIDLKEMETSWLGGRVPLPNLEEMILGALSPAPAPMGPNARFGYPLKGGFQALMNGFLPYVQDRLLLSTRVVGISPSKREINLSNGATVKYEQLISTMPLPVLIRMMGAEVPESVRKAADGLRHTSVKCVNIGVGRENVTDKHWIYYPEDTVFHRIFVQGNASPHCNKPGGFGFTCEITYSPHKPLPCDGEELIKLCIKDAIRVGFIKEDDAIWAANVVDMPYAYVIYDHARPKNIETIRAFLKQHDIVLVGRYSEWEYYNSDHAFLAGKRGAEEARDIQKTREREQLQRTPARMRASDRPQLVEETWRAPVRTTASEKSRKA